MTEREAPFVGKFAAYDPVEPLWPYGAVAYMFPVPAERVSDGKPAIGVRKVQVIGVHPMPDGWRITAGTGDLDDEVLDVDEDGESAECIPWNDDLEATYGPKPPPAVVPVKRKGFFAEMWALATQTPPPPEPPKPPPAPAKESGVDVFNRVMAERPTREQEEAEERAREEEQAKRDAEIWGEVDRKAEEAEAAKSGTGHKFAKGERNLRVMRAIASGTKLPPLEKSAPKKDEQKDEGTEDNG
ncbi:UNVERIFIED_CONTAM: hypothetical protein RF653_09930 [Kocuria sp. CPCC 205316]|uniref:hypothetical protein n=1 Tax=Kocuria TaxID=57493 RepID=UPI0036DB4374